MVYLVYTSDQCCVEVRSIFDVSRNAKMCRVCLLYNHSKDFGVETFPCVELAGIATPQIFVGIQQVGLDEIRPSSDQQRPFFVELCFAINCVIEAALGIRISPLAS